ncbi:MAG: type IV pili methyl-accepting chemotaxis transducer N-terminal domain-containing protein [Pseudomonadota bacterium]
MSAPLSATAEEPAEVTPRSSEEIAERLVIAGRQRMLAEGMAAKLCLAESGIARENSQNELYLMWNIFDWYHVGLVFGNPQLGLAREESLRVVGAWRALDGDWAVLKSIYEPVLEGASVSAADFAQAQVSTGAVTQGATDLVAALRAAYSQELGPQGFGSALLIDLYERQRMLTQRMAKDVCLISRGETGADRQANLTQVIEIFDASLNAFQNGLPEAGVPQPPTQAIAARLSEAKSLWDPVKPVAFAAAGGRELNGAELTGFAVTMDRFLSVMTAAINELVATQGQ